MTVFVYANNAATTLAGPIAANATTLNLAAGTGALFPTPAVGQQFALTLQSQSDASVREITYCTGRSGDTCTVVRAQEGTPATAFIANDNAANLLTAGTTAAFIQLTQLQAQATNYGVDTGTVNAIVVSVSPAPASLALIAGTPIRVLVKNTNTGATTITLNGLATTAVVSQVGTPLTAGQVIAGQIFEFFYNPGVGFEVETPLTVLGLANTWALSQTLSNNSYWSGQNSSGVAQKLIGYNASNIATLFAGPSGANAWQVLNNAGGTTLLALGAAGLLNVVGGVTLSSGNFNAGAGQILTTGSTQFGSLGVTGNGSVLGSLQVGTSMLVGTNLTVSGAVTVAGGVSTSDIVATVGVVGGMTFFSNGVVSASGALNASGTITGNAVQSNANVSAGQRLIAALGAFGSGNPNAGVILSDFNQQDAGLLVLPSGLYVQWGTGSFTGPSGSTLTKPFFTTFPNAPLAMCLTVGFNNGGSFMGAQPNSNGTYGVSCTIVGGGSASGTGYSWIAIGV